MAQADQLRIPDPARTDARSFELLRVWVAHQDQHISIRTGVWEDAGAWGVMLADLARHIANAFEMQEGRDPLRTLDEIKAAFEAELQVPAKPMRGELAQ